MELFKDIFSHEEIITNSFGFEFCYDKVIGKVQSKYITVGGDKFDIGAGDAFKAKDEEDEGVEDTAVKVLDVLAANKYQETTFDKKSYTAYIKGYMKKIVEKLTENKPDRVDAFKKGAQEAVTKFILPNFDEFTFYLPESYDCENTVILSYYPEGAETPIFVFFMDGLKGQRV